MLTVSKGLFGAIVGDGTPSFWEYVRQIGSCLPGTEEAVIGKIKRLPNATTDNGKAT